MYLAIRSVDAIVRVLSTSTWLILSLLFILDSIASVTARVYLKEAFTKDDALEQHWFISQQRSDYGRIRLSAGRFPGNPQDKALQTMDNNHFYALSTRLTKGVFNNQDKTLIVQYSVKHEQNIDCGGGYIKLLPDTFEPDTFDEHSKYNIMFGPDICGMNRRVHVVLAYQNTTISLKRVIVPPSDQLTHLYTLIIRPDQTFKVLIDLQEEAAGHIIEDFNTFPPKTIPDPNAVKPNDWIDDPMMIDASDKKPLNYDDIPQFISLPGKKRPIDWNDEEDGEWIAPVKENPLYKGPWQPRRIRNPSYQGPWTPPHISNPEYNIASDLGVYNTAYVGFDIWQVKAGTLFDHILITDNEAYAHNYADKTFVANQPLERAAKARLDEEEEKAMEEVVVEEEGEQKRQGNRWHNDELLTTSDLDEDEIDWQILMAHNEL